MRLGGPVSEPGQTPQAWILALKRLGYTAAYCPLDESADTKTVKAYARAAEEAGIVIAEVGVWNNPLSSDPQARKDALKACKARLDLAEKIGARCCVNIAGSMGEQWDGPDPDNLGRKAYDLTVESVRDIIDSVKPARTFYTLEPMPWMFPDSPESYLRLIKSVDRRQFGAHLDPVNMVNSPSRYFDTAGLLRRMFKQLGPHIRSCHAKDITLSGKLTTHLDEVIPGQGGLDYGVFLQELSRLDPDTPLMLEHLQSDQEYFQAAQHVRTVAKNMGLEFI